MLDEVELAFVELLLDTFVLDVTLDVFEVLDELEALVLDVLAALDVLEDVGVVPVLVPHVKTAGPGIV